MVCGTYVLTDTISKAFTEIFTTTTAKTSAIISGRQIVSNAASGNATLPDALVARVQRTPGVAAAAGLLTGTGGGTSDQVRLIGRDGKAIGNQNAPKIGIGIHPQDARFNPMTLTSGRWPARDGEVAI